MKAGWTIAGMKALYPTQEDRDKHRAWLVLHCQARYRGEECTITEAEFFELWKPHWPNRGRGSSDITMTRIDPELAWTQDNVEFITRKEHLKREKNFWKGK